MIYLKRLRKKAYQLSDQLLCDGEKIQFSEGFTDLHTRVYEETLKGNGFGIEDARPSIMFVQKLRSEPLINKTDNIHPFALKHK